MGEFWMIDKEFKKYNGNNNQGGGSGLFIIYLILIAFVLATLLLGGGCARKQSETILNAAFKDHRKANPWEEVLFRHVKSLDEIKSIDYYNGVVWVRLKQPRFWQYIPIGTFAQATGGAVSSKKEWWARPAPLPNILALSGVALAGSAGMAGLVPAFVFTEELCHVRDEILHPRFWETSETLMWGLSGGWANPTLSLALRRHSPLYFFDPREIKAKTEKYFFLSSAPNIHCEESHRQWEELCFMVALSRLLAREKKFKNISSSELETELEVVKGVAIVSSGAVWWPLFEAPHALE